MKYVNREKQNRYNKNKVKKLKWILVGANFILSKYILGSKTANK